MKKLNSPFSMLFTALAIMVGTLSCGPKIVTPQNSFKNVYPSSGQTGIQGKIFIKFTPKDHLPHLPVTQVKLSHRTELSGPWVEDTIQGISFVKGSYITSSAQTLVPGSTYKIEVSQSQNGNPYQIVKWTFTTSPTSLDDPTNKHIGEHGDHSAILSAPPKIAGAADYLAYLQGSSAGHNHSGTFNFGSDTYTLEDYQLWVESFHAFPPYSKPGTLYFIPQDESKTFKCPGSLLNEEMVITAGHCVSNGEGRFHTKTIFIPEGSNTIYAKWYSSAHSSFHSNKDFNNNTGIVFVSDRH